MTTLTLELPDKFKTIISDNNKIKTITGYFIDDYLQELFQDSITKTELENNKYDLELNKKLKKVIGI